jgi:phosphoribosylformylglycinamidine cyclo-ligase
MKKIDIHALSHITGGGLLENLPRVMPENVNAVIDASSWQRPAVFDWLQEKGNIIDEEMYRTFNNGIGMVVCVAAQDASKTIEILEAAGENAVIIGQIEPSNQATPEVIIK